MQLVILWSNLKICFEFQASEGRHVAGMHLLCCRRSPSCPFPGICYSSFQLYFGLHDVLEKRRRWCAHAAMPRPSSLDFLHFELDINGDRNRVCMNTFLTQCRGVVIVFVLFISMSRPAKKTSIQPSATQMCGPLANSTLCRSLKCTSL